MMIALYAHGMGRTPYSGRVMMRMLKKNGFDSRTFAYVVTFESFQSIKARLKKRIIQIAAQDDYIVIGHSLGGVLLRAALNDLPEVKKPAHAFLLGSPISPSTIAKSLQNNFLYRLITQDCGQLLASSARMEGIGPMPAPTTAIVGNKTFPLTRHFFNGQANDGVVSEQETHADWFNQIFHVPVLHSWLPQNEPVARIILDKISSVVL